MEFVDTNVLVRYLTRDDPAQATRAAALFQQVSAGERTITTCEGVLVETVQVLSSRRLYDRPRAEIQGYLTALLSVPGFRIPAKRTYLRALEIYGSSALDFVDALLAAHVEQTPGAAILSFDRDFDRMPGIERREP